MEKIILITGACGAIGTALAHRWDKKYHLLLLDNDSLALQNLDADLQGNHTLVPFDLWASSPVQYDTLAKMIAEDYGKLDGLIHLASYCGNLRPLIHTEAEDWLKALQVNVTAPLWLTQACLPLLQNSEHPALAFSTFDTLGEQAHYWHGFGVAQAALQRLIRDLAEENGPYANIAISQVQVAWTESRMARAIFPNGQAHWIMPEESASLYDKVLTAPAGQLTRITHEKLS